MTDFNITELRELAENATPGPWEYGDRWHIQGATKCQCHERYGPLLEIRRININGQMMDAHIHKREKPWYENGIMTSYAERGHPMHVVIEADEYGAMSRSDAEHIAAFNPETALALLDRLEQAEAERDNAEKQVQIRSEDSIAERIARSNVRAVDEWVRLKERVERAEAAIERAREIHGKEPVNSNYGGTHDICLACEQSWPCPTAQALDGVPEPEPEWEVQYGRRNRETGALHWLTGDPRDDWWHENQDRYEHVKRYTSSPLPVEGEKP